MTTGSGLPQAALQAGDAVDNQASGLVHGDRGRGETPLPSGDRCGPPGLMADPAGATVRP